jgi:6,7-dimethyl-8-ribityllumazine synthase
MKKNRTKKLRIGIVASKFNEFITQRLIDGCLKELKIRQVDFTLFWVPGSFELPLIALKLAKRPTIDAVICLGSVIRGETPHFDLVARACQEGILHVSLETEKPIIFGVLTTENVKQAYARSKEKGDNKGCDAAIACCEMINCLESVKHA